MASVRRVRDWYAESFHELVEFPRIQVPASFKARDRMPLPSASAAVAATAPPVHRYYTPVDADVPVSDDMRAYTANFVTLIVLASSSSSSSSSKVFLSSAKLPLNGTSISMPENKQTTDNNECVDSTPTPTVGTLKSRFERQLKSAPGSPTSRSPCSRSSDQVHVAQFGDAKNQLAQGNNETKSVPACAVTAAVVLEALAGVHVSTLRGAFESAAVATVTPAAVVPTTQAAVATATALIKTQETSACPELAGTVATEIPTSFESTAATHVPAVPAQAEKKRSTAGKVLRWVRRRAGHRGSAPAAAVNPEAKVAAVVESMAIDSTLVKLPAEFGSDQTLVESASSSRWSSIKARVSNLLGGASSTVKVSAATPEPRSIKFGVKVLPNSSAPVVLRSAVAAVDGF
ncbi:[Pyruvate dehydrogenase (acetyl-transferring)] kinase isozyme 2 [Blastocladiella emersonii ATCC 22665]|nr:[Pyruvate dehydrogenase (acetyl-transferring)] kinase isozyme 2 [Blastocladiella emersonii ATCC 22665]